MGAKLIPVNLGVRVAAFLRRVADGLNPPRRLDARRAAVVVKITPREIEKAMRRNAGFRDEAEVMESLLHKAEKTATLQMCDHIRSHRHDHLVFERWSDGRDYYVRACVKTIRK